MSMLWNESYYPWDGATASDPRLRRHRRRPRRADHARQMGVPLARSLGHGVPRGHRGAHRPAAGARSAALLPVRPLAAAGRPHPVRRVGDGRRVPADLRLGGAGGSTSRADDDQFLAERLPGACSATTTTGGTTTRWATRSSAAASWAWTTCPRPHRPAPRPTRARWMAFFARDMARIASRAARPGRRRSATGSTAARIQDAINAILWDEPSGFYYDQDAGRHARACTSRTRGLVPAHRRRRAAGAVAAHPVGAARREPVPVARRASAACRRRPAVPARRRLARASTRTGAARSGCRSTTCSSRPLTDVDPSLAADVRERVVDTSRPTGAAPAGSTSSSTATPAQGLGADDQAGWTALVANLIARGLARAGTAPVSGQPRHEVIDPAASRSPGTARRLVLAELRRGEPNVAVPAMSCRARVAGPAAGVDAHRVPRAVVGEEVLADQQRYWAPAIDVAAGDRAADRAWLYSPPAASGRLVAVRLPRSSAVPP